MTIAQQIITISICVVATMLTRFLPFLVFKPDKETPAFIKYLGKALPCAIFGMLIIYCLKDVDIAGGSHGFPELIALCITCGLHLWKRNMLISIAAGTICYMLLVQLVF